MVRAETFSAEEVCTGYAHNGENRTAWKVSRLYRTRELGRRPGSAWMSKILNACQSFCTRCLFLSFARLCGRSSFEFVLKETAADPQEFCRLGLYALATGQGALDQVVFDSF